MVVPMLGGATDVLQCALEFISGRIALKSLFQNVLQSICSLLNNQIMLSVSPDFQTEDKYARLQFGILIVN